MSNMSYKLSKDYQLDNFSENINQTGITKRILFQKGKKRKKERKETRY